MTPSPGPATLRVLVAFERIELQAAGLPVQIRRPSMVIVDRGRTGEPIQVEPGEYLVTVRLPGGDELFERVEVGPGEQRTVALAPPPAAAATAPLASPRYAAQQYFSAGPEPDRAELVPGPVHSTATRMVHLRLLEGHPLRPPLRTVGAAGVRFPGNGPEVRRPLTGLPILPPTSDRWLAPDRAQLGMMMPGRTDSEQVFWLRVTAPPDRTRFVAVPALPGQACTLLLARPDGGRGVTVDFHLLDAQVDVLVQYRQSGDATAARALLRAGLAQHTGGSPLVRAALAHAALRLGVDREIDGTALFERSGTLLPDAWLVEAEFCARQGEHERAQDLFVQSLQWGLPVFSDGLGWLSSRLPQYVRLTAAGAISADGSLLDQLSAAWELLRPVLASADLKPAYSTLRGNTLRYTDHPL